MNPDLFAKAGAIFYVLWGLAHLNAARMMFVLGESLDVGMLQGRIFQHGWNLMFFAVFAIFVAIWMNWKNSRLGYWLNLCVISAGDVGFILFVLAPGYLPMMPGAVGPTLWIIALGFSTVAIRQADRAEQPA